VSWPSSRRLCQRSSSEHLGTSRSIACLFDRGRNRRRRWACQRLRWGPVGPADIGCRGRSNVKESGLLWILVIAVVVGGALGAWAVLSRRSK
jgi:hypothetical protein